MSQAASVGTKASSPVNQGWHLFLKSPIDWIFLFGLIGLAPLVYAEARSLWTMKHYQFFPIAWAAFIGIVYLRGQLVTSTQRWRVALGSTALFGAFLLTIMAVLLYYPKVAQVAMIGLCLGWLLLRMGGNPWFQCFAWITLLLVTVRLPVTLDQSLIHNLQMLSSRSASQLMDLTGIPHLATGNIIEIRPGQLFVEEACSGVDSFYALGAVALMLCIWQQRGFLVSLLTLASVPLWAWFGNVIRLFVLAYLYNNWDINLTEGWEHTVLGLVIFAFAFGGLLSMQETLSRLLWPLPRGDESSDWATSAYNWLVTWPHQNRVPPAGKKVAAPQTDSFSTSAQSPAEPSKTAAWVLSGAAVVVFALCGFWTAGRAFGITKRNTDNTGFDRGLVEVTFSEDNLPETLNGMRRKSFEITHRERSSVFGAHSATWVFQDGSRDVVVSLDFPFTIFHPLEVCYISTGSTVQGDILQYEVMVESEPLYMSEVRLKDLFGEHSYLLYTEFNDSGVSLEREEVFSISSFFNKGMFRRSIGRLFQLQVLVSDAASLTDEERARYKTLLTDARATLLPKVQELTGNTLSGVPVAASE